MKFIYIIFLIFIISLLYGCGDQKHLDIEKPEIKSNYEINITYSIKYLKRELGDRYFKAYPTEEKNILFVQSRSREMNNGYTLIQYDISKSVPKLINIVVEGNISPIVDIGLLPEHKLIYVRSNYKSDPFFIKIYDYLLKKEIRSYEIRNYEKLIVSRNKLEIIKGEIRINIDDIYEDLNSIIEKYKKIEEEKRKKEPLLFRDNLNQVVIDRANKLIWQDDSSVMDESSDIATNEAICLMISGFFDWRIPTKEESIKLIDTHQKSILTVFQYIAKGQYTISGDEGFWWFDMNNLTVNSENNKPGHRRCVADYKE